MSFIRDNLISLISYHFLNLLIANVLTPEIIIRVFVSLTIKTCNSVSMDMKLVLQSSERYLLYSLVSFCEVKTLQHVGRRFLLIQKVRCLCEEQYRHICLIVACLVV